MFHCLSNDVSCSFVLVVGGGGEGGGAAQEDSRHQTPGGKANGHGGGPNRLETPRITLPACRRDTTGDSVGRSDLLVPVT